MISQYSTNSAAYTCVDTKASRHLTTARYGRIEHMIDPCQISIPSNYLCYLRCERQEEGVSKYDNLHARYIDLTKEVQRLQQNLAVARQEAADGYHLYTS